MVYHWTFAGARFQVPSFVRCRCFARFFFCRFPSVYVAVCRCTRTPPATAAAARCHSISFTTFAVGRFLPGWTLYHCRTGGSGCALRLVWMRCVCPAFHHAPRASFALFTFDTIHTCIRHAHATSSRLYEPVATPTRYPWLPNAPLPHVRLLDAAAVSAPGYQRQ